jgi:hypothetical protein
LFILLDKKKPGKRLYSVYCTGKKVWVWQTLGPGNNQRRASRLTANNIVWSSDLRVRWEYGRRGGEDTASKI